MHFYRLLTNRRLHRRIIVLRAHKAKRSSKRPRLRCEYGTAGPPGIHGHAVSKSHSTSKNQKSFATRAESAQNSDPESLMLFPIANFWRLKIDLCCEQGLGLLNFLLLFRVFTEKKCIQTLWKWYPRDSGTGNNGELFLHQRISQHGTSRQGV